MGDLVPFVVIVGVAVVGGIRLGMLLSTRIGRLADRVDDEPDVPDVPAPASESRDDA